MDWTTLPVWRTAPPNNGCLPARRRAGKAGFAELQPNLSCTWLVCYFPHWFVCVCVCMCMLEVCLSALSSGLLAGRQGEVSLWHYEHTEDDLTLWFLPLQVPELFIAPLCAFITFNSTLGETVLSSCMCCLRSKLRVHTQFRTVWKLGGWNRIFENFEECKEKKNFECGANRLFLTSEFMLESQLFQPISAVEMFFEGLCSHVVSVSVKWALVRISFLNLETNIRFVLSRLLEITSFLL